MRLEAGRIQVVARTDASPGFEAISVLRVDPTPIGVPSHLGEDLVALAALALPFGLAALFLDLSKARIGSRWARGAGATSILVASAVIEGVVFSPYGLAPTYLH